MESNSNRIKLFTSNVLERVTSIKKYIGLVVLIIIIIFIGYYLSYNVRTNKKVQEVLKTHKSNIRYQTNYCHENYRSYSLVDFHVKSSFNPVATGYRKFDYLSLDMLYQVLRLGTRYLEFEIFAKDQNNGSIPVISVGSKLGDWKMTANVLDCKKVLRVFCSAKWNCMRIPQKNPRNLKLYHHGHFGSRCLIKVTTCGRNVTHHDDTT